MWRTYNHSSGLFLVSSNVSFVNLPNDVHTYFRTCFCETYWMSTIRQHWSQETCVLRLIFCQLFYFIVQKNNTNKNNFMSILLQVCKTFFFFFDLIPCRDSVMNVPHTLTFMIVWFYFNSLNVTLCPLFYQPKQ